MSTWNWSRASICVGVLVLCATSQASWPKRYDNIGGTDDAVAIARDNHGNVFVCGKVAASHGFDYGVVSYDSAGTQRWTRTYDGSSSGDDIATSIAVDQIGNVYVAGYSYGGTTRRYDFTVVKYDTNGSTVWPNSGSHTLYDFDNGAIRLKDNATDGDNWEEGPVCEIAIANDASEQPTFAITGPSTPTSGHPTWRTAVFEADATDGVRLKAGWPVDDFGASTFPDMPRGIAMGADYSVFVTGAVHDSGGSDEAFTTVRYKADGNNASGNVHYWTDMTSYLNKPTSGRAIALDHDDNAYVTGNVAYPVFQNVIQTMKIERDPSSPDMTGSGNPVEDWSPTYYLVTNSYPTSISLSFEVESGVLKTYAYVAGMQDESHSLGNRDIPTIRYRGTDGNQMWANVQGGANQDDVGFRVVGAGRGNAYVTGVKNNDYVLYAYDKTGTLRFSPVTYNNGAQDIARSLVLTGAGQAYYTGSSFATSQGDDFLTASHTESSTSFVPTSYSVPTTETGGLTELGALDSSYFEEPSLHISSTFVYGYSEFTTNITTTNPSEMSLTIVSHVTTNHIWQLVEVYDQIASAYVMVADGPASNGTDATTVVPLKDDVARFLDGSGNVTIRVTFHGDPGTGWVRIVDGGYDSYYDLVRWDVLG